jgi:hypothetical protein
MEIPLSSRPILNGWYAPIPFLKTFHMELIYRIAGSKSPQQKKISGLRRMNRTLALSNLIRFSRKIISGILFMVFSTPLFSP